MLRFLQRSHLRSLTALAALLVAGLELASFWATQAQVVSLRAWEQAGDQVREEFREGDLILSSPTWTDPLLRAALGDLMKPSDVGYSDLARYQRVWELSLSGTRAVDAPEGPPEWEQQVGPIRVRRFSLGPSPVRYDFLAHVDEAKVSRLEQDVARPCPWQSRPVASPGGVHQGVMVPKARHVCPGPPWLWVGETVMADLSLQPRSCIWQHPAGPEPVVTAFSNVPLGERLVLHGGLFYDHEVLKAGAPVEVLIRVDGASVGKMVHRDGDGWKQVELPTRSREDARARPRRRGTVSLEVRSDNPSMRSFCWTASTRSGPPRPSASGRVAR